jgi:hypothetical protein
MTRRATKAPCRSPGLHELLSTEVDFLTSLIKASKTTRKGRPANDATQSDYDDFVKVAELLRVWHTEAPYIDGNGDPAALAFDGKAPSIRALATDVAGSADAKRICELIKGSTILQSRRKSGKQLWTPRGRSAVNANLDSLVAAYCLTTLQRMATTLRRNVAGETTLPGINEFERSVDGHRIAPEDLPAFNKFLAIQGQYFVDAVDDWLIRRTNRAKSSTSEEKRVPVSVHAFAWTGARRVLRTKASRK